MQDIPIGVITIIVIIAIIQIVLLIATFTFFSRANEIKKAVLQETDYFKKYWIEMKLGNNDKAYEYIMKHYLLDVYDDLYIRSELKVTAGYRGKIEKICKRLNKPVPDFVELEKKT